MKQKLSYEVMAPEDIISNFRHSVDNIDCLVFEPNATVTKVVASFTGMNAGKYDRWSWYHNWIEADDGTVYVVFRDEDHLFYLNRQNIDYQNDMIVFLKSLLDKYNLSSNDLITVGSSMGGYAALYYGFLLKAKLCIVSVPLVDLASAGLHQYTLWTRKMNEVGDAWIDLDEFLSTFSSASEVFLIHGQYPADVSSSNKLVAVLDSLGCNYKRVALDAITHEEFLTQDDLKELILMSVAK